MDTLSVTNAYLYNIMIYYYYYYYYHFFYLQIYNNNNNNNNNNKLLYSHISKKHIDSTTVKHK